MIEHLAVLRAGCLSRDGTRGTADTRFLEVKIARAGQGPCKAHRYLRKTIAPK